MMTKIRFRKKIKKYCSPEFLLNLKTIIILGSFVHISATFIVYLIGKFAIFPNWIFIKGTMREDASRYLETCELLSQGLSNGNYDFLITSNEQIHIRFYTLAHFLLSDILGSNILTFELINLPLFLLILFLTYKIGEVLFDSKVGSISAYIIIFFPSFVLHTTQPLRDTLFITLFLFLFFQLLILIKKSFGFSEILIRTFIGVLTLALLWFVRDSMQLVYFGIVLITLLSALILAFKTGWKNKYNLVPVSVLLIVVIIVPYIFSGYLPQKRDQAKNNMTELNNFIESQMNAGKPNYLIRINAIRYRFSGNYKDAGSNVDAGYIFDDTLALVTYLPKAFVIGLLAPFPNTWLGEGVEYGKTGRILSGIETGFIYIFIMFTIYACWRNLNIPVLFITSSILIGVTALGLVVINVGAIYRLRYVLWLLLIILGTKGVFELLDLLGKREKLMVV